MVPNMTKEEKEAAETQKRSFERSLAGPSVGKAGKSTNPNEAGWLLTFSHRLDERSDRYVGLRGFSALCSIVFGADVNTIIAEASKVSITAYLQTALTTRQGSKYV